MTIPKIFHFVFFGFTTFTFIHYLSVVSCYTVHQPDIIYLYVHHLPKDMDAPEAKWFRLITPLVKLEKVDLPTSIFSRPVTKFQHMADIIRLEKLIERGGVYLDLDVVSIRPFNELYREQCVMGLQCPGTKYEGLCNAVIMSVPQGEFLKRWYGEYRSFRSSRWDYHSVKMPHMLSKLFSPLIKVVASDYFFPVSWEEPNFMVNRSYDDRLIKSRVVHLWESEWEKNVIKNADFRLLGKNSTFSYYLNPILTKFKLIRDSVQIGHEPTHLAYPTPSALSTPSIPTNQAKQRQIDKNPIIATTKPVSLRIRLKSKEKPVEKIDLNQELTNVVVPTTHSLKINPKSTLTIRPNKYKTSEKSSSKPTQQIIKPSPPPPPPPPPPPTKDPIIKLKIPKQQDITFKEINWSEVVEKLDVSLALSLQIDEIDQMLPPDDHNQQSLNNLNNLNNLKNQVSHLKQISEANETSDMKDSLTSQLVGSKNLNLLLAKVKPENLSFHQNPNRLVHFLESCQVNQHLAVQTCRYQGLDYCFLLADLPALQYLEKRPDVVMDHSLKYVGIGNANLGDQLLETVIVKMLPHNDRFSYCHPVFNRTEIISRAEIQHRFINLNFSYLSTIIPLKHLTRQPTLPEIVTFFNQNFPKVNLIYLASNTSQIHLAYLLNQDKNRSIGNLALPTNICLWSIHTTILPQLLKMTYRKSCRFMAYQNVYPLKHCLKLEGQLYQI